MRIGVSELIVVFIVALLVLGPDKLPQYARKFGAALAEFRKASDAATREIRENVVEPLEQAQQPLRDAGRGESGNAGNRGGGTSDCGGGVCYMRLGANELLLILLIVVIVFGPTQIPKLTRMMGKSVKQFKEGLDEEERESAKDAGEGE